MRAHQQKGGGLAGDMLFYPFGQEWQYDNGVKSAWWQFYNSFSRWNASLGFDLTPNRKYSPTLGRWMTPDPSGMAAASPSNPQTWNMYAYALNNPTSLIDTSGLFEAGPGDKSSVDNGNGTTPVGLLPPVASGDAPGSQGGGGGGGSSTPPVNTIKWPQLQKLVAANNESNQCNDLIDCIVFRESHLGKGGVRSGLSKGFNPNAISPTYARGLMQVEKISLKDVLTNGKSYPVSVTTLNTAWDHMFNPGLNIEAGSNELQIKIERAHGNLQEGIKAYGPVSGDPNYAEDVRNCLTNLKAGQAKAAYAAATAP